MEIQEYLITYEVFDKGCTIFRYYDENGIVLHKKYYLCDRYIFDITRKSELGI